MYKVFKVKSGAEVDVLLEQFDARLGHLEDLYDLLCDKVARFNVAKHDLIEVDKMLSYRVDALKREFYEHLSEGIDEKES